MGQLAAVHLESPCHETAAKLRAFVEREDLRYQSLSLPDGSRTEGHDRSYLDQLIFTPDIAGQSVLDIGSYLGRFCIGALRAGAGSATGIDPNADSVRRARELASIIDLAPEYIHDDFEQWNPERRQFDTVLCLNVLHHLFDPIHALRKAMALARRRVVLEVARLTWRDLGDSWFNPLLLFGSTAAPTIHLRRPQFKGNAAKQTFLISPEAMQALFNVHTSVFEPIRITRSPFKGRYIVDARKRAIRNLLVVAGVTSSGKSTFIDRLLRDSSFRARFDVPEGAWLACKGTTIDRLPTGPLANVILELDTLMVGRADIQTFERFPYAHLLGIAETVHVFSLLPPPGRLTDQMSDAEIRRAQKKCGHPITQALLKLYGGTQVVPEIDALYSKWWRYCARAGVPASRHRFVRNEWADFVPLPTPPAGVVNNAGR